MRELAGGMDEASIAAGLGERVGGKKCIPVARGRIVTFMSLFTVRGDFVCVTRVMTARNAPAVLRYGRESSGPISKECRVVKVPFTGTRVG